MTTPAVPYIPLEDDVAPARPETYLTAGTTIRSWLLTRDHKRIALLYLFTITGLFFVGGAAATLMRLELLTPASDLVRPEMYNRLFTIHGVVMVWLFLIPSIPTTFGNFLVPLMIGARDMAFPRLNLLSWYLFVTGAIFTLLAVVGGGVDTGWTFYTPYSSVYSQTNVVLTITGIFITGFSSILTGLNIIVTIHAMRCPGMTWGRLPLFCWSLYATSVILLLATPVLAMTLLLVFIERVFGVPIFDPSRGGDPLLFQHLFWFYSHPAVYIMILPGFGVISELISCFSRRRIYGYWFVAGSSIAIAVIGFLVWGHHMFVTGMSVYGGLTFSFLSFLVAVPSAIKVLNWTLTLRGGSIAFKTPMLYALGFLGVFVIGGLTGLFLASLAADVHLTDTYFVVAHFHYIMVGGMVTAYLGAVHFWFPKMFGKLYPEWAGRIAAVIIFVGFNLTFFPQYVLGYLGMPRRYAAYPEEFQIYNVMSTAGASVMAIGYLMPLAYLGWSLRYGKEAPRNPWKAMGMEWTVASPPPKENFATAPIVTQEPYCYHEMTPQGGDGPILPVHVRPTHPVDVEWSGQ